MSIQWLDRTEFDAAVRWRMVPADILLDVGAGINPQPFVRSRVHICVEPHATYVRKLLERSETASPVVVLAGTWDKVMPVFPDKSVDSVIAVDFIEHLDKGGGERFLEQAERVAKRQVAIFTPLGFYPQGVAENRVDRWGLDGGEWQAHRSGWTQDDFDNRWELLCCRHYHLIDEHEQILDEPFGALWAFRNFDHPDPPRRIRAIRESHRLLDRFWEECARLFD
jgi:hypothetical protein